MLHNQFQHYTREGKPNKLESVCRSELETMLRLDLLLDNPTLQITDTGYNDRNNINL